MFFRAFLLTFHNIHPIEEKCKWNIGIYERKKRLLALQGDVPSGVASLLGRRAAHDTRYREARGQGDGMRREKMEVWSGGAEAGFAGEEMAGFCGKKRSGEMRLRVRRAASRARAGCACTSAVSGYVRHEANSEERG